jgi:hypothetical protein
MEEILVGHQIMVAGALLITVEGVVHQMFHIQHQVPHLVVEPAAQVHLPLAQQEQQQKLQI